MITLTLPYIDYLQRAQLLAYIKRNKWVFNISAPTEDLCISRTDMYAKIDKGVEEYNQGKTTKLDVNDINSFLGL
jgi:hypothetical protein